MTANVKTTAAVPVPSKLMYSIGIGVGVTTLTGLSYWLYKHLKKDVMPTKWRRVGILAQLNIFPIKSCGPLKLDAGSEVECDALGLRIQDFFRDRCLMLVDEDNKMITARSYPKMIVIQTTIINPTTLLFTAPGIGTSMELDFATLGEHSPSKDVYTAVHGVEVTAILCGKKYDDWFSKVILQKEIGLRLVYFPYPKPVRAIAPRMRKEPFITMQDTGTFNDTTSYMLINLASVEDLNTRIPRPVDALQFRGNFNIKMDESTPFAEDNWGWIKIGDEAVFRNVSPCTRCIVPNINIVNGERDPDSEPLKTLNKYRKWEKYPSPVMGIHLGIRRPGSVKISDVVYVEEK